MREIALSRWGVDPPLARAWFGDPGWFHVEVAPRPCPDCAGTLHCLRQRYDFGGRTISGVALVCPTCPATYTLADLGVRTYRQLSAPPPMAAASPDATNASTAATPAIESAGRRFTTAAFGTSTSGAATSVASVTVANAATAVVAEGRLLHWHKITDSRATVPACPSGVDLRVLLPDGPAFDRLDALLSSAGVSHRRIRHLVEQETLSSLGPDGRLAPLWVSAGLLPVTNTARHRPITRTGAAAMAARDAFELAWDNHDGPFTGDWTPVAADRLVPSEWAHHLPRPTLNPTQAAAAPQLLTDAHLLVVAPTGAGKTMIGMLAALRAIVRDGRKAAWLVPQRSLTDELDRELEAWRSSGLRVQRLSGEYVTDVERARHADLWVSTTEKFEAVCRASSLRTALADVACLIVDEIHLLGSAGRGPLLEALLARVRGTNSPVRVVGLSATVANADEIAAWLGAEVVRTNWRPTRLTWQLPMIPATRDRRADSLARTRAAVAITRQIAEDGGSVLVFCGSRRGVRATALALAADRGAVTTGVDPDDLDRVHQLCARVRIGLHYKDWEHRHAAERDFRARRLDVLVATTTVAAGVNLPARAVIVRDTTVGLDRIDVATVQQMFGRAGRVGAGETEGWAFLLCDESERPSWQARLVDGYTVRSHIADGLADHLLAEVATGRVTTVADAETWWRSTLAHHQTTTATTAIGTGTGAGTATSTGTSISAGTETRASAGMGVGGSPVPDAVDLLVAGEYLSLSGPAGPDRDADPAAVMLTVTELGMLTTRLMVPVSIGTDLRDALGDTAVPAGPEQAEWTLGGVLARLVPSFAEAPVDEGLRPWVAKLLRARGRPDQIDHSTQPPVSAPGLAPGAGIGIATAPAFVLGAGLAATTGRGLAPGPGVAVGPGSAPGLVPATGVAPGDLAQVAFALVATSPRLFTRPARTVAGLPTSVLTPILAEAPRYFAWLAAQGRLGSVHPWVAVCAADLGRRIRWRRLGAPRGAGRLLWICEQMATAPAAEQIVPALFTAARRRDVSNPDWPVGRAPHDCRLDAAAYLALLRDRATDATAVEHGHQVSIAGPVSLTAVLWADADVHLVAPPAATAAGPVDYPAPTDQPGPTVDRRSTADRGPTDHSRPKHLHALPANRGAALFTRLGDYRATGWLAAYNGITASSRKSDLNCQAVPE
ncbi:DEAD/DEAH box helicase [Frankia sp. AiPa1]|uniref:DEAD/DEAH box helicase n=1 Tax=Frankia sp. AiPa1 TaxID=573492 RepID=UPI00202B9F28|nr:DEAD/DEAH box helicase [Frankia sp. AiPa1]MCL9758779.1 DEAD/DEAH box helicase [Frankia sp. AiPa1]